MSDALSAEQALEAGKTNATVVGSDVISFTAEVKPEMRQAIIDSALLAQLAATRKVADASKVYDWYDTYFTTLKNVGWVVQDHGFAEFTETANDVEAHKAVLDIAAGLLGPGSTALSLVKTALDSLLRAQENEPFFVIFNRETRHAESARFQVSVAEGEASGHLITLVAFGMKASTRLTHVLIVKLRSSEVEIKHQSGKATINADLLQAVHPLIQSRILAHQRKFIVDLPI
ncbi:hypothetical protein OIU35_18010 [Boseaceae bacterium BT-24-1]|nr:hypothetical protein [Boseaceae bacterium BT-24-1]